MSVEEIYFQAIAVEESNERNAFLDRRCGGDAALRERVVRLLDARERRGSFLDSQALAGAAYLDHGDIEGPGASIGPYKLLEVIGEGGMGVVYMAEQSAPVRRRVALKIIKPGMDTRQVIARFEAERQALALMDHPGISRVLDAGATESGRPFFVMELVRGVPITEFCDREQLSITQRLELFVEVCSAVQHAHQKGVIHRDLKPGNILVSAIDGAPRPKIIDFGIAKATGAALTERTLITGHHQFVGTPLYMSPEQADYSGVDVDTRSDIYVLGVLLYELLTGTTPVDDATARQAPWDEFRQLLKTVEPPAPSARVKTLTFGELSTVSERRKCSPDQLSVVVRGELDWIVLKALDKDRNRRYETASAFAADVRRFLADEAVEACPPTRRYLLGKFVRRRRVALMTAVCVLVSLAIGFSAAISQAFRAVKAERLALAAELVDSGDSSLAMGIEADVAGNFELARSHLEAAVEYHRRAIDTNPRLEIYRTRLRSSYTRLMFVLVNIGDHVAASNVVEDFLDANLRGFPGKSKDGLVHSAILIMVRCAGLAALDPSIAPETRLATKRQYLARVRQLLQGAKPGAIDSYGICIIADLISVDPLPGGLAPDLASQLAARAMRESDGDPFAKQSLAWAEFRVGEYESCIELIGTDKGHSTSGGFLAMAQWMAGDHERALKTYENAAAFVIAYSTEPIHPQRWMLEQVQIEAAKLLGLDPPNFPSPTFRSY